MTVSGIIIVHTRPINNRLHAEPPGPGFCALGILESVNTMYSSNGRLVTLRVSENLANNLNF
jgi:hypothetical protein